MTFRKHEVSEKSPIAAKQGRQASSIIQCHGRFRAMHLFLLPGTVFCLSPVNGHAIVDGAAIGESALVGYELRACVDSIATTQITEDPSVRSSSSVCSPCIYFRLLQQNFRLPNPCNDPHATAIRVQIIGIFPLSVTRPKNFIMADPWKAKPYFFIHLLVC